MESGEASFDFQPSVKAQPDSSDFSFPDKAEVIHKVSSPIKEQTLLNSEEGRKEDQVSVKAEDSGDRNADNSAVEGVVAPNISWTSKRDSDVSDNVDHSHNESSLVKSEVCNEVVKPDVKEEIPDTVPIVNFKNEMEEEENEIHMKEETQEKEEEEEMVVDESKIEETVDSTDKEVNKEPCGEVEMVENVQEEVTEKVDGLMCESTSEAESKPPPEEKATDKPSTPEQPAMEVEKVEKTAKEMIIEHLDSVWQYLDDFVKTKDEHKIKDCMNLLIELKSLAEKTLDNSTKETPKSETKKGSKRGKAKEAKTRGGTNARSTQDKNDADSESDFPEFINLKEIKGLAVFAKWPNSGWYYPGVVRDFSIEDWKTSTNVTVCFYDGVERDMKSVYILPAQLIPISSLLFDLDVEIDMTVVSIDKEGENWVKFTLSQSDKPNENISRDFDKLAIKSTNMKTIKQAVDSLSPNEKASTTVVSGRRSRGKSSVFNEDYVSSSPRSSEKRKVKAEDDGEATPSRSASKRRQVNGKAAATVSTPKRKSTRGK